MPLRRRTGEIVTIVAIFAVTLLLSYRFSLIGFDAHHTGLMYKTALDVSHGKMLYRETFTQYGALTAVLQALAIRVLGEQVTSILFSTAVFYAGCYVLLYLLARRLLSRALSLLSVLLTLSLASFLLWTFHPWSSVYALFFLLLATLFTVKTVERGGIVSPLLAGLCALLGFWCRQPVGIVTLVGVLLCPLLFALWLSPREKKRQHLRSLALVGAGALVGFLLLFVPICAGHALRDFYRQSISGMLTFASSRSGTDQYGLLGFVGMLFYCLFLAPLDVDGATWFNYVFILLPLCSVALLGLHTHGLIKARRSGKESCRRDVTLAVLSLFSVFSWHQYYPVGCLRHWYWAAFPSILTAVILCLELLPRLAEKIHKNHPVRWLSQKKLSLSLVALALAILFLPNLCYRTVVGTQRILAAEEQVRFENENYIHLDGLYLEEDVALYYDELFDSVALLEEHFPDTNVINTTENGINAVFGENFHPLFNNAEDFYYEEYPEILADYIEEERPIVIGPEAPAEGYVLFAEPSGSSGDAFEEYHHMPARIFVPAELYEQLPAEQK